MNPYAHKGYVLVGNEMFAPRKKSLSQGSGSGVSNQSGPSPARSAKITESATRLSSKSQSVASGGELARKSAEPIVAPDTIFLGPDQRRVTINCEPCPAPRMTQQDRWRGQPGRKERRAIVQKYFDYRDEIQRGVGDLPVVPAMMSFVFVFEMPASWSEKKRVRMDGQLHRQRPDSDNCIKAVLDSLFAEDGSVAKGSFAKLWGRKGSVTIIY